MIDRIIRFSLENKLLVLLGVLALIVAGIFSMRSIPLDAVPDITNNQVQIVTVSPALAPQEVEQLITYPLESKMTNVPGVEEVRSLSRYGLSVVTVVFEESMPVMKARQYIQEQLTVAESEIPTELGQPELMPITTGLGEIYQYVLLVEQGYEHLYDATELRTIQDWIVKRQLNGTPGIIEVSSFGGYVKEYEVAIDPPLLRAYDITAIDVLNALEANNANSGGSYIETGPYSYYIRTEGRVQSLADLNSIAVTTRNQRAITVGDVARLRIGSAKRYGAMTMDGKGEVVGGITLMLKGANSSEALRNVKARIEKIQQTLPEGIYIYPYLDRSKLIGKTTRTVSTNLIEGGAIVIIILLVMLGNLRAGLIVASVIPISMLFAFIMMRIMGISANLMSLGAIDFGIVVDGAVIIVESLLHVLILGYMGQRLTQAQMDATVRESASKIYRSAAFGVLIILVVFIPILTLQGIEGATFRPMAQTFGFAITGSLLLSVTYVPVVSSMFLSKKIPSKKTISDKLVAWIRKGYDPLLGMTLRVPGVTIMLAILLLGVAIFTFSRMGAEFVPTLEEGDLAMQQTIKPGSSLEESIRSTTRAEHILISEFPEVIHVVSKIGTGEIPTDPMAIEDADIMIILKDKSEWVSATTREELIDKMKRALSPITWASYEFTQPIQLRFNELMTGAKTDVSVKILGENTDTLAAIANRSAAIIQNIQGAADVKVDQTEGLQQLVVEIDRSQLSRFGVSIDEVNRIIRTAYAGVAAGVLYENERKFDIVVRLLPEFREELNLDQLFVNSNTGSSIPLSAFAQIAYREGPMLISREQARRFVNVGVNVRERDVESLVENIEANLADELELPAGYEIQYGGQFENLLAARARLLIAVPVALFLIFLLLQITFNSISDALIIFAAIPLSAIGGVFALTLRGMPFSISSGIGFITLFGVSVLNGIVLLSAIKQSNMSDFKSITALIGHACSTRLRPVLITALVAAFGFLPMALSTGNGAEVQRPLATVVIGGLISSTVLTLFILPALYYLVNRSKRLVSAAGIVILSILGSHVQAQTITTFEELQEIAMTNNPILQNMALKVQKATAEQRTVGQWEKLQVHYSGGNINTSLYDNYIQVSQGFGQLFGRKPHQEYLETTVDLINQEQALELLQFEKGLLRSFNLLSYESAKLSLLQNILTSYENIIPQVETQLEVGEIDVVTHGLATSALLAVRHQTRMQEVAVQRYQAILKAMAFLPDSATISVAMLEPISLDTSRMIASVEIHRKIFESRQASIVSMAEFERALARKPDLNLGLFTQSFDKEFGFYGVTGGVGIPIDRRTVKVRIDQLELDRSMNENERLTFERFNKTQMNTLLSRLENYAVSIDDYARDFLETNAELKRTLDFQFESASIDFVKYQQIQIQFLQIENAYLELIREYNNTILELMYYNTKSSAS